MITPQIRGLNFVSVRVRQGSLGNLTRIPGRFCDPITEGGAHAVDGEPISCRRSEALRKRHVGQWASFLATWKDQRAGPGSDGLEGSEQCKRLVRERNPVISSGLHPRPGDDPECVIQVDFAPTCSTSFTGAGGRKNYEPQTAGTHPAAAAKSRHYGWQVAPGNCRVMLNTLNFRACGQDVVKVPTPCCRIFSSPPAPDLCVIQNRLDPPPNPACSFRLGFPDRLQDTHNVIGCDCSY